MKRSVISIAIAAAIVNLVPIASAHASCDPATLRGSGCTTVLRCLPNAVGQDCLK